MRENRRVGIQHAVAMLKSEREHQGMSLADISRETGFSKYAEALRMDLSVSLRLKR
jgi:lambda repressor-like predicted transcriptional regulator